MYGEWGGGRPAPVVFFFISQEITTGAGRPRS